MTRIKFCGLSRPCDIEAANALLADYIGFVFASKSRRYVTPEQAAALRQLLAPGIQAVGVFVDAPAEQILSLLRTGVIDIAQLHGHETEEDIRFLQDASGKPVIRAFRVHTGADIAAAQASPADLVLLDSGAGTGTLFNWELAARLSRPCFLAGGLDPGNAGEAVRRLHPFALDVSSGIETEGLKDYRKMAAFAAAVREETMV